ncbi:MAG: GFA family protein [Steroidobacteraceae bacterium]
MSFVFRATGGCLCGAIRYDYHGAPYSSAFCHCRNCQRAHGAAFAPLLFVHPQDVVITRGSRGAPRDDRGQRRADVPRILP